MASHQRYAHLMVHQIRNSCKYVVWKEKKEFTYDLKNIYNAPTKEVAALELDLFDQKWGKKNDDALKKAVYLSISEIE